MLTLSLANYKLLRWTHAAVSMRSSTVQMQWMLQLALTLNAANAVVDVAQVAAAHAGPSPVLIKGLRLQFDVVAAT